MEKTNIVDKKNLKRPKCLISTNRYFEYEKALLVISDKISKIQKGKKLRWYVLVRRIVITEA